MNDDKNLSAAPGVTKEVEDAISLYRLAVCNDLQNITHERVAARAALLAAIEKYAEDAIAASRAENAALAALIDEALGFADAARTAVGSMSGRGWDIDTWRKRATALVNKAPPFTTMAGPDTVPIPTPDSSDIADAMKDAQALRAGQQKGTEG